MPILLLPTRMKAPCEAKDRSGGVSSTATNAAELELAQMAEWLQEKDLAGNLSICVRRTEAILMERCFVLLHKSRPEVELAASSTSAVRLRAI